MSPVRSSFSEPRESRIREIFLEALGKTGAAERSAWLDRVCLEKPELRVRVEALLRSHREDDFLETPARELKELGLPETTIADVDETTGGSIGPFKLVSKIGEGGCGIVYVAEQGEPIRRRVALKLIKAGMDTRSVIARFEAERQALALMDHPNIAKVLDAGATETGRPYFVMELVRGIKITEYCDQNSLSTRDRLDLFIKICQAIQHAHQKGIIHRDIKPSNILITLHDGVPVPKVIDFGIAKATTDQRLTDKTVFTALEQFIGTPAYMSPEQAEMSGLDIDTRCDIYSLGVLLYELLAGKPPFDNHELLTAGLDEMRRIIREVEPARPSQFLQSKIKNLKPKIDPDLDWIVLKCLEKDRARRYETANGLATDIQRYLNNETILARPPSALYRFQKLVRRHKLAVAAAGTVALTLIAGLSFSTWAFLREAAQRRTAVEQQLIARQRAYASDMDLAYRTWTDGNLARAQELIEANRPTAGQSDLRTFEWRYLWKLCRDESRLSYTNAWPHRESGFSFVSPVALSSDGQTLIAAAGTKLKLLDVTKIVTTQSDQVVLEDPDGICGVVLSPGQTNLVATTGHTGENHTIKLWDLASRQLLSTLNGHTAAINAIAFSPDGKLLASAGSDGWVRLWNIDPKKPQPRMLTKYYSAALSLVFSPNGKHLVTSGSVHGNQSPIRIFDLATDEEMEPQFEGHTSWVYALAFSPDGRLLASAGGESTIFVWDFAARKLLYRLAGHGGNIRSLAFSPDGRRLVSGGVDLTIRIWDVTAGRPVGFRRGHRAAVNALAISSDGQSILSASISNGESTAKLWNLPEKDSSAVLAHNQSVYDLALSPDDKTVASVIYDTFDVHLWDATSRRHITNLSGHTESLLRVAFSPDGKLLGTGGRDRTVHLWDMQNLRPLSVLTNEFEVCSVSFARDGRTVAAAGAGINFWDVQSQRLARSIESATGVIRAVAFSPVDDHVATGDVNGNVVLWDGRTGKSICSFKPHRGFVWRVVFSNNGAWLASAGYDASVVLYDVTARQMLTPFLKGHTATVTGLAFSPDNKTLASGGYDGRTILWNVASRQLVLNLMGHVGTSFGVVFSRDGTFMATCGSDAKVRIWPAGTFEDADGLSSRFLLSRDNQTRTGR